MDSEVLSKSVLIEKFRVSEAGEIKVSSDVKENLHFDKQGKQISWYEEFLITSTNVFITSIKCY